MVLVEFTRAPPIYTSKWDIRLLKDITNKKFKLLIQSVNVTVKFVNKKSKAMENK